MIPRIEIQCNECGAQNSFENTRCYKCNAVLKIPPATPPTGDPQPGRHEWFGPVNVHSKMGWRCIHCGVEYSEKSRETACAGVKARELSPAPAGDHGQDRAAVPALCHVLTTSGKDGADVELQIAGHEYRLTSLDASRIGFLLLTAAAEMSNADPKDLADQIEAEEDYEPFALEIAPASPGSVQAPAAGPLAPMPDSLRKELIDLVQTAHNANPGDNIAEFLDPWMEKNAHYFALAGAPSAGHLTDCATHSGKVCDCGDLPPSPASGDTAPTDEQIESAMEILGRFVQPYGPGATYEQGQEAHNIIRDALATPRAGAPQTQDPAMRPWVSGEPIMDADDLRDLIQEYADQDREYHAMPDGPGTKGVLDARNEAMHCAIEGLNDWMRHARRLAGANAAPVLTAPIGEAKADPAPTIIPRRHAQELDIKESPHLVIDKAPAPAAEGLDLEALDRLLDLHGRLIEHRGIIGQSLPCCESHVDLSAVQSIARRLRVGAEGGK